jgi:hypothetical protein
VSDESVSTLARVEHERRASRATELKRCRKARVATADDDDVVHDGGL